MFLTKTPFYETIYIQNLEKEEMNFSVEDVEVQGEFITVSITFDKEELLSDQDVLVEMVEKLLKNALDPEETDW